MSKTQSLIRRIELSLCDSMGKAALDVREITSPKIESIVDVIDPLCRTRFKKGDCLPRGHEGSLVEDVNRMQEFRERAARAKVRRIQLIIEKP